MRLRHVGMGFFWACSMLTFRSSILLSGSANTPEYESLVVIVSFVANITTMLAVAAWVENDPVRIDRLPIWPLPVLVVAGLLLVFAAGRAGGGALLPLLLGGAVVAGVGYGLFWGSWADCYGRMHPARTSFYLPVTFLLTAALFLAVSLLSENLGVPAIMLMLPLSLASYACLLRCRAEQPDGRAAPSGGTRRSLAALGSLLGLIVASLVLSCLFGFVWELTVFSVGSVNEAHLSPLVANLAVAAALVGLVLYARTRINLDLAYRIIVPVIVVLFAVLPFFWETNPVALNIIMSASYGLFDVIIWSLVAACSYDFAVSAASCARCPCCCAWWAWASGSSSRSCRASRRRSSWACPSARCTCWSCWGCSTRCAASAAWRQATAKTGAMRTWTGWQSRRRSEGRPRPSPLPQMLRPSSHLRCPPPRPRTRPPCQPRPLPQHRNRHRHLPHPKPLPRRPPTMPSRSSTPPSQKTTASPAARPRCCPSWLAAAPPR